MKNKGFTLIELLIVITIMASIGIVISVSLSGTLQNTHQKECDEFVTKIENAACVYVGLSTKEVVCNRTTCSPIRLELLIKEGLIEEEPDVCTGTDININETVSITWDETGEKHCEYNGVKKYER